MDRPVDPELPQREPGEPSFATLDEVCHDVYAEHGPAVLREALLANELSREDLEDCAAALEVAGKLSIAAIVLEIAANRPSAFDLDNPYEPGSMNWRYWRQNWLKRRRLATGELEAGLRHRAAQNKRKR
jgi:hypothetical protein